jgi:hypothetical protein
VVCTFHSTNDLGRRNVVYICRELNVCIYMHKSSVQEVKLWVHNHGGGNNNELMGLAVDAVYDIEDE